MHPHPLFQRGRVERPRHRVGPVDQGLRDAVALDVEKPDLSAGLADPLCGGLQRGAIVAGERTDIDQRNFGEGQQLCAHGADRIGSGRL